MTRSRTGLLTGFVGIAFLLLAGRCEAAETAAHEFVGVAKCGMCHKKAEIGEQVKIWQGTAHAKAFESLASEQARQIGTKLGIPDPQASGKCLKCHATAYDFTEAKVSEKVPVEEGVSCESCHGAGKDYMKKSVMQDKAQAAAAGLIVPDQSVCGKCHNAESPVMKTFDFEKQREMIKHPVPKS